MEIWDPEAIYLQKTIEREVLCGNCGEFMVKVGVRVYKCHKCGQQYIPNSY